MQEDRLTLRPARQGDGQTLFDVSHRSVQGLGGEPIEIVHMER